MARDTQLARCSVHEEQKGHPTKGCSSPFTCFTAQLLLALDYSLPPFMYHFSDNPVTLWCHLPFGRRINDSYCVRRLVFPLSLSLSRMLRIALVLVIVALFACSLSQSSTVRINLLVLSMFWIRTIPLKNGLTNIGWWVQTAWLIWRNWYWWNQFKWPRSTLLNYLKSSMNSVVLTLTV